MTEDAARIVTGRSCEGCAMCCYLLEVEALEKPAARWCAHCAGKRACAIYPDRPQECRDFHCGWLTTEALDERWFPAKARLFLASEHDGMRLTCVVDPARPDAWRKDPYYGLLKGAAKQAARFDGQVCVKVGRRWWVVLPDEDVALGEVGEDEVIVTEIGTGEDGSRRLKAMTLPRGDPRAKGMA
ncbi:MAG: hypothetical protein R6V44_05165 [Paracoccaceae bacterium]